jgi:hypothetical protein
MGTITFLGYDVNGNLLLFCCMMMSFLVGYGMKCSVEEGKLEPGLELPGSKTNYKIFYGIGIFFLIVLLMTWNLFEEYFY